MYATCRRGHRHWGLAGAAGALVVAAHPSGSRLLLTLRSAEVHQGGTWSIPGGAIDPGDADAEAAARRELHEEIDYDAAGLPVRGRHMFSCGGWTYETVVLVAPATVPLTSHGWETDEVAWLLVEEVDRLADASALHPGFATSWPALRNLVWQSSAQSGIEAGGATTPSG